MKKHDLGPRNITQTSPKYDPNHGFGEVQAPAFLQSAGQGQRGGVGEGLEYTLILSIRGSTRHDPQGVGGLR